LQADKYHQMVRDIDVRPMGPRPDG